VVAVCLACVTLAGGQTISLSSAERIQLQQLVKADREAGRIYSKLKQQADEFVDDEPQPIARIQTGGKLEADLAKKESRACLEDMKKLDALSGAYAVSSANVYGAAMKRFIASWAETNQPTGLPVDETKLEPLFVAYDLIRSTFTESERAPIETWLRRIAEKQQVTGEKKSVTATNNWNSHRVKIVGLIGFLLSDQKLIQYAVDGFKRQVEINLRPDGSSFDFHERDALHYHCYGLEPLLTLALVAERNGYSLYSYQAPGGASLPKAVAFLAPYCRREATHAEWVDSNVAFDRLRAEAGERKFAPGSLFEPRQGRRVFELASFFENDYRSLVSELSTGTGLMYPTWQMVLNDVCHKSSLSHSP
jgi:hypothetical protein